MMTDPIADFLSRIRNALMSGHESVVIPSSKMKLKIAELLKSEGYINDFHLDAPSDRAGKRLTLDLKYDSDAAPIIEGIKRVSKPGLRVYKNAKDLPKVRGGLGMAVMSTSKGIMTDAAARKAHVGGEVVCYVW